MVDQTYITSLIYIVWINYVDQMRIECESWWIKFDQMMSNKGILWMIDGINGD